MATRILVIGSSSLVGSHFVEYFSGKYEISAIGRKNIFESKDLLVSFHNADLKNRIALQNAIESSDAEFVINYAARTDVDQCEKERGNTEGEVYLVNTECLHWITEVCRKTNKMLFQISTDFVFDGTQGPYTEDAIAGPIGKPTSWYGFTKHLAEKGIIQSLSHYCIARISYPYRAKYDLKLDFARSVLELYGKGRLYPLFTDQIISPTLIDDVSAGIDFLIRENLGGIYHIASRDTTSPFDFASKLISVFLSTEDAARLERGSILKLEERSGRAPRPVKGGLLVDKITNLGFTPKTVSEGVQELYSQFQSARRSSAQ